MSARNCERCGGGVGDAETLCAPCEVKSLRQELSDVRRLLSTGVGEVRRMRADINVAIDVLQALRSKAMLPSSVREAVRNQMSITNPGHPVLLLGDHDALWMHIVPAYKTEETVDVALRSLRGGP